LKGVILCSRVEIYKPRAKNGQPPQDMTVFSASSAEPMILSLLKDLGYYISDSKKKLVTFCTPNSCIRINEMGCVEANLPKGG